MQPQQQVDPAILQISEFFSTSIDEGKKPEEVVISLMEQKVDQNTIAQALMNMGYVEEDLTILFKNVESLTKPKPPSNQQINNNPQQLSRDQAIQEGRPAMVSIDPIEMANDGKETSCTPAQIASGTCGSGSTDVKINMNSQGVINPNINNNVDEGVVGSPMYVNPVAFPNNSGGKNIGSIANFLLESNETLFGSDLNSRGEKSGALRDWKTKGINNKIDKQLNANYTATIDFSDENIGAVNNWYNQYMDENPERNEINQIIENIPPPEESKITKARNSLSDWMDNAGANLTGIAKETNEALRRTLGFRYGGDLDKAQFAGQPDFENPFEVIEANDQMRLDEANEAYTAANQWQGLDADEMVSVSQGGQQVQIRAADRFNDEAIQNAIDLANAPDPTADDLFAKINKPTVEADYGGLGGFIDRTLDSNLAKGFGAVSDVAVKGAGLLTDFFDTSVEDAKTENYNTFALADNVYGTKTNAFNKRGKTDINTGQSGADSDKVTGLFMSKGGGINNEGFKALPSAVQHNILSNLAYGGSTGPEAYLANRDMVIKREMAKAQFGNGETEGMRQREGSYNPPNRKYTLDPRFKKEGGETVSVDPSMLAKLIAAGADIEML